MPCLSRIRPSTSGRRRTRRRPPWRARSPAGGRARAPGARRRPPAPARRRSAGRSGSSTALACVWSTNSCGRKACSSISTDGLGAVGSSRLARWTRTMSSSLSGLARAQLAQAARAAPPACPRARSRHVAARALDAQHLVRLAEQIGHLGLERGVAAAVQHERRIAAQQPRRVDAQRQRLARARGAVDLDRRAGVGISPAALHLPLAPGVRAPLIMQRRPCLPGLLEFVQGGPRAPSRRSTGLTTGVAQLSGYSFSAGMARGV